MPSKLNEIFKPKTIKDFEHITDKKDLWVLLIRSVEFNFIDGVILSIKRGVDINYLGGYALKYAVMKNNIPIIKLLMDKGADYILGTLDQYIKFYDDTEVKKLFNEQCSK